MSDPIVRVRRSSVPGKVPLPTDLMDGEIAINTHDEIIYFKNANGTISSIANATGGTALIEQIAMEKAIVMAIALG